MKNRDWPYWSKEYKNARDFRAKKRRDVRATLKSMSDLRCGCAYTPAQDHIDAAYKHLEMAKSLMSVERWKR